jgi:hypothetical protein
MTLGVLALIPAQSFAELPRFLQLPPGKQVTLKAERADVPLGPIVVPFTKGWSFAWHQPVFVGQSPDGYRFEATYAYDSSAFTDEAKQVSFLQDNRNRLPKFQKDFISEFGDLTKPCFEEPQPLQRFRYICIAEHTTDGKTQNLIAYAYVGRSALVFINFYGEGPAEMAYHYTEAILANARWFDDAAKPSSPSQTAQ